MKKAAAEAKRYNLFKSYFPDTGPLRRELYPKHQAFFAAGLEHRERLFLAANRVGKSIVGCYELTCHLTGNYPHWWIGRRFDRPVSTWAAGETSKTAKDILQNKLLGNVGDFGTGLIPKKNIVRYTWKRNVPESIHDVFVKHISGGDSVCQVKSYEEGRESYQGTEIDAILLDEEPDIKIYTECLLRTMTTNGLIICTFTPLKGLSEVVLEYLPGGKMPEPPKS